MRSHQRFALHFQRSPHMGDSFERVLISRKWRDLGIKIEGPSDSTGCQGPELQMTAPKGKDKPFFWNEDFAVTSGQVSPEASVVCSSKKSNLLGRWWLVSSLSCPSFFLILFWILQVTRLLQLILRVSVLFPILCHRNCRANVDSPRQFCRGRREPSLLHLYRLPVFSRQH